MNISGVIYMINDILDTWQKFGTKLINGMNETLLMVGISFIISMVIGTIIGVLLALMGKDRPYQNKWVAGTLAAIVNIIRSIPFMLFLIVMIPVSRFLIGTGLGVSASIVSLSIIGLAVVARLVEQAILDVNPHLYETADAMGFNIFQLIMHILLVEARSSLVLGYTSALISIISYSTVVGVVNGGGIGTVALNDGFYYWDQTLLFMIIAIMIIWVQLIQMIGSLIANKLDMKKRKN